jgi:hypothetical protein
MSEDRTIEGTADCAAPARRAGRFLGSLRDALRAAGRDQTSSAVPAAACAGMAEAVADVVCEPRDLTPPPPATDTPFVSAAEAAREARGGELLSNTLAFDSDAAPPPCAIADATTVQHETAAPRTQLVRGKAAVRRGEFDQDPVVGWLVVVGGAGLGRCRPVFEGNNAIGRAPTQRIPLDFGDETISSEEQAYIRYDSSERSFLFVPNLAKTNVVSVNDARPTAAVELQHMDVITIGRTQLVFVPFCGAEFDWSDIAEAHD